MASFSIVPFETINNCNGFCFYKLLIDNTSHYDLFIKSLERLPNEKRSLRKVLALMEMFSPKVMLLNNKFRQLKGLKRRDIYEFKADLVRIYVILNRPEIYVFAGSLKKNQDKTIKKISNLLKNFNIEEIIP